MRLQPDSFDRLCRARTLLSEERDPCPSIKAIAREVGISHFHFIRQFEALFGVTPHQYRIRSRLRRAKQLLAAGRQSVTDVCLEVGMSSPGSFSDLFSRRVGKAPSVYRGRAREVAPAELFPGCLSLMGSLPEDAFRNFEEARPAEVRLESD